MYCYYVFEIDWNLWARISYPVTFTTVNTEDWASMRRYNCAWVCACENVLFYYFSFRSICLVRHRRKRGIMRRQWIDGDEIINSCCRIRMSCHRGNRIHIVNDVQHRQRGHSHTLVPVQQRQPHGTLKTNRSFQAKITIIINSPPLPRRPPIGI